MDIKFQCTKDSFKSSTHNCVLEFDAYENYEQLNEYFGSFDESLMCSKEEYFGDGIDYELWDDYVIWEDGRIVSRAAIWKYSQTAWEVAGVSTLPEYRCKGYGKMIVSHCTAVILNNGKIATCTTRDTNHAMRRTAEKVGFMAMTGLEFKKLERNDSDIAVLRELHSDPSVKKWLSIGDNYFEYCTSTQNVQYIKILLSGAIIGGIHIERNNDILYLSIFIASEYRQKGYARECIGHIVDKFTEGINFIKVSIEEENIPSIKFFESLGFVFADQEEELKNYVLNL